MIRSRTGSKPFSRTDLRGTFTDARIQSMDKDGQIDQSIPIAQVIGCVVHANWSLNDPGFVKHHFGNDLIVGSPPGGETVRSLAVAAVPNQAGFSSSVSERIQNDVWYKLWGNMTINTLSAITEATTDAILDDDLVRGFMSRVMLEARKIGIRFGLSMSQEPGDRHAVTRRLGAFKTSMRQFVQSSIGLAAISAGAARVPAFAQSIELAKILCGFTPGGTSDAISRRVTDNRT